MKCNLYRLFITMIVASFSFTGIMAQTWNDVTDQIITNAAFNEGNVNGWNLSVANSQNIGYQSANYSGESWISGFAEAWRPAWNGVLGDGYISQSARLANGKYRLQADCIANYQNNSSMTVTGVYLFAKDANGEITKQEVATGNGSPQHYSLEFQVSSAGIVEMGLMLESPTANWVACDNFTLEYSGTLKECQSVSFNPSSVTLNLKEEKTFTTTYFPTTATLINYKYVSSNEFVAKVDETGKVIAKGSGTATIQAQGFNGNVLGTMNVEVVLPEVYPEAIVINEIQSCNLDMFLDPSMNYGSWIEIYNPTTKASGLGGLYISDDPSNLKKWRLRDDFGGVSAKGYRNIWFDHYGIWKEGELSQVNFKLNYEGGTIILSDGSNIIAQQDYPQGISRTSYARKKDGGEEWGLSGSPTPEATNNSMAFAVTQLPAPELDKNGIVMSSGSTTFKITNRPTGATLRYTTDGSTPTASSSSSSSNTFNISKSSVYRFRFFKGGYLPSEVVTRSVIIDDSNLPIISIATADDNLNSTDRGLFTRGPNGRPGNGQDSNCNWNMDWDRPVNFEYFNDNKEYALNQEVDMSMCGGWSRANSPHSFKLKAAKYYCGQNSMDYQFFDGKPFLKHKVLQIRNGGSGNRTKDAGLQEVMRRSGLYIDTQSWKPVRVYINGSYYADLNMREPNNKHFGYANYGIDTDYMDQFEMSPDSGYVQMVGTKESFNRLLELSANASDPTSYNAISELLDIDEYINYMAIELYLGNWDWPQNNVKGFRDQNNGKFHFVVYDLDGAFSADVNTFFNKQWYKFDNLRGEDALGNSLWGQRQYEEIEFVTLFANLLNNMDFRKKFVDAMSVIGGSVFDYDYASAIVNDMVSEMGSGDVWSAVGSLSGRQNTMAYQIKNNSRFGVSDITPQQTSLSSNVESAQILVNDIVVPTGKFNGYLFSPATIKAAAPAGYKFKGWKSDASPAPATSNNEILFSRTSSWTYDDSNTSLDGTNWKTGTFSKSGLSPIGYDSKNSKSFNTTTEQFLQTYYFTKTFNISDNVNANDVFTLDYTVDDGMVVYINGEEAGRYNMTDGEVTFGTNGGWAQSNPDNGTMTLPSGLFKLGTNTIAVEVHNFFNPSSTDIYWDASLNRIKNEDASGSSDYFTTKTSFNLPTSGDYYFIAEYEKLSASDMEKNGVTSVKVNEVSANNDMYVNDHFKKDDWIELYNTTDADVDIAGMYISDDETQPQKFQIPANDTQNTVIAPRGHLVLWASNRENNGEQIHANFKLGNSNGSAVMLTSADGEWSDKLTYSAHGTKETVGVYPDGGRNVYHMYRPTIGAENTLTSYAQFLYDNSPLAGTDQAFTLTLSEGWNWISHPLERNISITEINKNAKRILSQTDESILDPKLGWKGSVTSLVPTSGYKVLMNADDEQDYQGPFFAEGNTIALRKGWNWIGYPVMGSQTISAALAKFSASEGDQIIGQYGFATYENGKWSGSLSAFATGAGYLYKSTYPKSLSFAAAPSTPAEAKPRFQSQPLTAWTATATSHPNVMGVIAKIIADGQEAECGAYSVGAFSEEGECRGVGKYVDGTLFITIYGESGDNITFRAADAQTGLVYDVAESLYLSEDVKGTRKAPINLNIGDNATDIASVKTSSAFSSIAYYTVNGIYAGIDKQSLAKGVYVAKITLKDGGTITKKIIKK